jgi:Glycosyltransferase family 87
VSETAEPAAPEVGSALPARALVPLWGGRRHTVRLLGFAGATLGLLLLLAMTPALAALLNEKPLSDVRAYYDAAARLNAGLPLYPPGADMNASEFYRYPPLLAIVFRPLALFPYAVVSVIWAVVTLGAVVATLLVAGVRRRATWIWVGILAFPIAWSAALGQAQLPVTLLLALATPLSVALAGQLKVLPALAALWWLGRRDWRSLGRFAAWSAALMALQVVLEPRGTLDYLRIANLSQVGDIVNLSPYGISPILWAGLAAAGALLVIVTARRSAGWFVAVAYSTLISPRLIAYLFVALLGGLGHPSASRTDLGVPDSTSGVERAAGPP